MTKGALFLFIPFFFLLSCNTSEDKVPQTATTGELKVAVDESFWPIMKEEKDVFEYIYKYATLHYERTDQDSAIKLLLLDSIKLAVVARELNPTELSYLKSIKVYPKTYTFAQDGLLLLVNKESKDTAFTLTQLKDIATAKNPSKQLVFDRNRSAGLYSFVDLLDIKNAKLAGIYSVDSVQALIEHISRNKNAIGVLGSSWFGEEDNKKVKEWLTKVSVASVSSDGISFYKVAQSEIADSLYPLSRPIYLISRESQMSLANGYAAFLLGEKGQRILLKAGLLPAKIPPREVVVSKKSY